MSTAMSAATASSADALFAWEGMQPAGSGAGADEVVEGLFLSGEGTGADRFFARNFQIRLVVCCNAKPSWPVHAVHDSASDETKDLETFENFVAALREAGPRQSADDTATFVFNIAADDSAMFDLSPWFVRTSELLQVALEEGAQLRCLVHCLAGVSRSATVVAAYLMQRVKLSATETVSRLRKRRSIVNPNPGFVNQLQRWELMGYNVVAPGEARQAAERMAARLQQESPAGVQAKLKSYLEALLLAAGSTVADRDSIGALARELDAKKVLAFRSFVALFLSTAGGILDNDEAADTPVLPSRIVDVVESIQEAASMPSEGVQPRELRDLISRTLVGMGDQFGFDPFAAAVLLSRLSAFAACPQDGAVWIHLFAARLRSVLEAGTPMAFPPGLGVNFSDLNLNQLDDWTPALLPINTRQVLRTSLSGLARTMHEAGLRSGDSDDDDSGPSKPSSTAFDAILSLGVAVQQLVVTRAEGGATALAGSMPSALAQRTAFERAAVLAAFRVIGDGAPAEVEAAVLGDADADDHEGVLAVAIAETKAVLEACGV